MKTLYLLTILIPLISFAAVVTDSVSPEKTSQIIHKQAVLGDKFMLVTANPLATQAGFEILKNGGSAADALVAVQSVLGLVEPQSSGLGGGGFVLYYDAKNKHLSSFDARETAPLAAKPELFLNKNGEPLDFFDAVVGGLSVGTPGTVKMLATLHQLHGNKAWGELFNPAITLAENGFEVSRRLASAIAADKHRLSRYKDTRDYFFAANGESLQTGSKLINQAYADTLKLIAKQGEKAFYQGQIGKDIVKKVQSVANAGLLTLQDLAIYDVVERQPICSSYRKYDICGMGAPSSGGITIGQILSMLNHFELKTLGADNPISWQLIGDASRLAFADRGRYIADTDFVPMPEGILNKAYLAKRAALITQGKALTEVSAGSPLWKNPISQSDDQSIELPSTTHVVIVDKDGNIISMTSSIENGFGSRVMSNGFLLNNQLTDFSFASNKNGLPIANSVAPKKRPRSSMSPTIVFKNNKPYLAIGSPGGSQIIGFVAQSLIAHIDWGMEIQDAISMPRMLNRFGNYEIEQGTDAVNFAPLLQKMGYEVTVRDMNSGLHAILFDNNKLIGAADPRREGIAMGE